MLMPSELEQRRHDRLKGATALATALLLLTGCGSTVASLPAGLSGGAAGGMTVPSAAGSGSGASQVGVPGTGLPTGSVPAGSANSVAAATSGVSPGGGSGTRSNGGSGGAAQAVSTGTGAGVPKQAIPTTGRGWNAKDVYIGLTYSQDQTTSAEGVGLKDVYEGNNPAQAQAVANYLNQHGGILGRKVIILTENFSNASLNTQAATDAQASCTKFTQDTPVIAVINTQTNIDTANYRACLSRAGVPLFDISIAPLDNQTLQADHGLVFPLIAPTWNRFAPTFVARLRAQGYFKGWNTTTGAPGNAPVKVGVLVHDDPVSAQVYDILAAALAKIGEAPALVFRYQSTQDMGSAVLHFRSAGITHVIETDNLLFVFATAAESQHYRPRYGVSSFNGPYEALQANTPSAQLQGSMGVGFMPSLDVGYQTNRTPGGGLCRAVLAAGGQTFAGERFAEAFAFSICDALRVVAAAASAGEGFTAASILRGMSTAGPSFRPAATFSSALTANYSAVPGSGLDIQYESGCACYQYPSPGRLHGF